jgi:response regulator RpfG family c-di-GMP phosphodiesterase
MTERGYKILVVDDEEGVADIMGKTLKSEVSSDIIVCTDPERAVRIAGEEKIAVLLSDLKMPIMDGLTLSEKVREISPNTVCILITGWATKDVLVKALNDGVIWKCLEKPCPMETILSAVKDAVGIYKSNKKLETGSRPSSYVRIKAKKHVPIRIKKKSSDKNYIKLAGRIASKRYTSLEEIAHGGSGVIYKAMDTLLDMPVAIKILAPHLTKDKRAIDELFAEARIAMRLSHKHIVRLHNMEEINNAYYLVMEYIEGTTLRDILSECISFPIETIHQIAQICNDAISYAHRHDVFHRDIKPENFMLSDDGMLKIIDFGLACLAERPSATSSAICGTPFYVSPEELRGEKIDQRSDLFSLAVVFHELLTGFIPFGEDQNDDTDMEDFVPVPLKGLSPALKSVFTKAFASNPDDRHEDVHEFVNAFRDACPLS